MTFAVLHLHLAAGGIGWLIRWLFFRVLWRTAGVPGVVALVLVVVAPTIVRRWRQRR